MLQLQNLPSVMRDDKEAVQHSKRQSRHREGAHRGDNFSMVLRNAVHCFAGSGFLGALRIQRKTVRSENIETATQSQVIGINRQCCALQHFGEVHAI